MGEGGLRSKHGCWTCRLRKKKCDERRPKCSLCESHMITCHGYGPRPEWKDNAEAERALLKELKETVRKNARLKVCHQSPRNGNHSSVPLAPLLRYEGSSIKATQSDASNADANNTWKPRGHSTGFSYDKRKTRETHQLDLADSQTDTSQDPASHSWETPAMLISARDSVMLMHFLDYVFLNQYPMYQPRPLDGGRGWLMSLLFESKPFYHSALALSSYSRLLWTQNIASPQCLSHAGFRLEHHLEVCLQEVRQTVRNVTQIVSSCQDFDVGTVLAVIQLVFIEVKWPVLLKGSRY